MEYYQFLNEEQLQKRIKRNRKRKNSFEDFCKKQQESKRKWKKNKNSSKNI